MNSYLENKQIYDKSHRELDSYRSKFLIFLLYASIVFERIIKKKKKRTKKKDKDKSVHRLIS